MAEVPTQEEFDALAAIVAKNSSDIKVLQAGGVDPPVPPDPGDYITTDGDHDVPVKLQSSDGRKLDFSADGTFTVDGVKAIYGANIKKAGLSKGAPYQFANWGSGSGWFDIPPLQTPGTLTNDPFAELPSGDYPPPGPIPAGMTSFLGMSIGSWGNRIVQSDWGTGSGRMFAPGNAFMTAEGYMVCRHIGGNPDTSGEFGMNGEQDWRTKPARFKCRTYIKAWLQGQVRAFLWLFNDPASIWELDIEGIGDGARLCLHGPGQPNDGSGLWFSQTGLKPIGEHEWWIDYYPGDHAEFFLDGKSIGRVSADTTTNKTFIPAGFNMRALFSNWSGEWAGPVGTQTDDMVVYDYGIQDL